jgi:hypothetical protein
MLISAAAAGAKGRPTARQAGLKPGAGIVRNQQGEPSFEPGAGLVLGGTFASAQVLIKQ